MNRCEGSQKKGKDKASDNLLSEASARTGRADGDKLACARPLHSRHGIDGGYGNRQVTQTSGGMRISFLNSRGAHGS